jgi:hypothetical protein
MKLLICFIIITFNALANSKEIPKIEFTLEKSIFETQKIPFKSHQGKKEFDTYLTMELPFAPVEKLLKELEKKIGKKLKTRKEAHITVVTPTEYFHKLSPIISMNKIENIAKNLKIQNSPFKVVCLGKAQVKKDETYFLIIESEALLKIRSEITKEFIMNRGPTGLFRPIKDYFPHITIGFTKRDLHIEDGVIKNKDTCIADIKID